MENIDKEIGVFDKFLEFADISSVFKVLSRTEYIILWKIISKSEKDAADGGRLYLEDIKNDLNIAMPKVSEIVRAMSEEGWLLWKLDADTKKTYIEVTDSGREKCNMQREGMRKIRERLECESNEKDKEGFLNVARKYKEIIDEEIDKTEAYFDLMFGRSQSSLNILGLLRPKSTVTYVIDDYSIKKVLEVLRESGFATIPVINKNGVYRGTVSEGDLLWYIDAYSVEHINEAKVSDIVNTERNPSVHDVVNSKTLLDSLMKQNFLCMVDDRDCFIGIITRKDIIMYLEEQVEKRHTK